MKVGQRTIEKLAEIVTGNNSRAPYRSGPKLIELFNQYGFNDHYGQGFGARKTYAEERLSKLNGTDQLRAVLNAVFDAREFVEHPTPICDAAAFANQYLKYDGYEMAAEGDHFKVRKAGAVSVNFIPPVATAQIDHTYIEEHVRKCDRKIAEEDFSGAITNARTLLEGILLHIEERVTGVAPQHDGDLIKLYRRVQKLLNLDPDQMGISEPIKQLLSGMISVVNGLASMRNKMSDAHAGYRPSKHHAKLAVNAAKTLADFLFDSYSFQVKRAKRQ